MAKTNKVKARVLNAHPFSGVVFEANALVYIDEAEAKDLEKAGIVDTAKAAVEYLESQKVVAVDPTAQVAAPEGAAE